VLPFLRRPADDEGLLHHWAKRSGLGKPLTEFPPESARAQIPSGSSPPKGTGAQVSIAGIGASKII
jgi:hypothetical protein